MCETVHWIHTMQLPMRVESMGMKIHWSNFGFHSVLSNEFRFPFQTFWNPSRHVSADNGHLNQKGKKCNFIKLPNAFIMNEQKKYTKCRQQNYPHVLFNRARPRKIFINCIAANYLALHCYSARCELLICDLLFSFCLFINERQEFGSTERKATTTCCTFFYQ